MAIKIGSNFTFQGEQPNFERDRFATKAAMKAFPETSIDDGHLSYCVEDGNTYQFKSSNSVDTITGKWRVFKADVDLSTYATKDSVTTELSKKVDIKGVKSSTTTENNRVIKILTINVPNTINLTGKLDLSILTRIGEDYSVSLKLGVSSGNNISISAINKTHNINYNLYYVLDTATREVVLYYIAPIALDYVYTKVENIIDSLKLTYNFNGNIIDSLPEGAVIINNINYNSKKLFYATPKDATGNPTFRAIDITDLPDLSSKYATKEKAFTTDIVSTVPGQFVAGPATTQGNLYLRKLVDYDIPDLKSKYQPINGNGIQEGPRAVGLSLGYRAQIGYLKALISASDTTSQVSPDWYYATDGTLQDITTKIPKITLDDAVSTTSTNGVENQAITKYVDGKVTTINSSITDLHTSLESTQTDFVDLRNKVNAMPKTVFITQAAYDALSPKDANTIYYIDG